MPTTFVLVHGAFHGPWCWERLVAELEARGHRALTVDLPATDPAAGHDAYVGAVGEVVARAGSSPVVVGHSYGGLLLPVVAARHAVARLVYLGAFAPVPGRALVERMGEPGSEGMTLMDALQFHEDGTASFPPDQAAGVFFSDCTPEDQAWASARLRRQGFGLAAEPCPLDALPPEPAHYVVLDDDRALPPEWCRWMAREVLGVEPHVLPGGHSPFLTRPTDLADLLTREP